MTDVLILPMKVNEVCPVLDLANDILAYQHDILVKIRRMKSHTKFSCKQCNKKGSCDQLTFINQQIDQSIREVMDEWGL
jgi:hypothetical protein